MTDINLGSIVQDALARKFPDGGIVCGETYESIQWLRQDSKPTADEVNSIIEEYKKIAADEAYIYKRQLEYPPVTKQLEMISDLGIDGWKAEIQKVKDKYPKPEKS